MTLFDWARKLSRRGFLAGGAATIATIATSANILLAESGKAAPAAPESLTPEQNRVLLQFTRDLFPHDRLPDSIYDNALAPLRDEAAKGAATRKLLADGVARLDTLSVGLCGKRYADAGDEKIRVAVVKQIENGEFFSKVYGATITPLYNDHDAWQKFGYPGASSPLGGYLHRGFNDLDWL